MKSVVSLLNYRSQGLELNFLHICIMYRNTERALFRCFRFINHLYTMQIKRY